MMTSNSGSDYDSDHDAAANTAAENVQYTARRSGLILPTTYQVQSKAVIKNPPLAFGTHDGIKRWLDFLHDNISLIVLVPTFLGASWQIIELARLNLSYIRFFSVTQVPVDGALIIFIGLISYAFYKFYTRITESDLTSINERAQRFADHYEKGITYYFLLTSVKLLVLFAVVIYAVRWGLEYVSTQSPLLIILTLIAAFIILSYKALEFIIKCTYLIDKGNLIDKDKLQHDDKRQAQTSRVFLSIYLIFLLIAAVFFIVGVITYLNDSLLIPYNLKNVENIEATIKQDYGTSEFDIKYLNDNYIFIQLCAKHSCTDSTHSESANIVIYKTADILFKP